MSPKLQERLILTGILLPVLAIWTLLSYLGALAALQDLAMDWRYRVRGPLEAPVKIHYVNRDETTHAQYGQNPFPRAAYARTARAVLELGGARAVFFDFVLSTYTFSRALDRDFLIANDLEMVDVTSHPEYGPRTVLAASFNEIKLPFAEGPSILHLKYRDETDEQGNEIVYNPQTNLYPEAPSYPIWNISFAKDGLSNRGWGRVAMINWDTWRSSEARWLPLYVESSSDYHGLNWLNGWERWLRLTEPELDFYPATADAPYYGFLDSEGQVITAVPKELGPPITFYTAAVECLAAAHGLATQAAVSFDSRHLTITDYISGETLYQIPMTDEQMIEVNWFSPWESRLGRQEDQLRSDYDPRDEVFALAEAVRAEEAFVDFGTGPEPLEVVFNRVMQGLREDISDPYNPQESMAVVIALYELHKFGPEAFQPRIETWFSRFKDAIILCGPTDPLLQDIAPTPLDDEPVPRISAHGNLIKTISSGLYIQRPPWRYTVGAIVLLTFAVAVPMLHGGNFGRPLKVLGAGMLTVYVAAVFYSFNEYHVVLPFISPVGSAISATTLGLTVQHLRSEKQKAKITGMFATYLAPEVVQQMADSGREPELGGEDVEISCFFSDVQGFSSFSELLTSRQLVVLLNEYLTPMSIIIKEEGGYVDKFIGDAIVAMFGAPNRMEDHAYRACRAMIRMQQKQAELRAFWASQGDKWPELVHRMRTRIGVNSGSCTVGNMGSRGDRPSDARFNYTMMGDPVNLAARCESGAKSAGVYSMIAESTWKQALEQGGDTELVFRFLDKWKVKGRSQPVSMYEVVGFSTEVPEEMRRCIDLYEQGLSLYFKQDWAGARRHFEKSLPLEPFNPDRDPESPACPSGVLLERIAYYEATSPGEDWDGVFVMKTK